MSIIVIVIVIIVVVVVVVVFVKGRGVSIRVPSALDGEMELIELRRHHDSRLEHVSDYNNICYYNSVTSVCGGRTVLCLLTFDA